MKVTVNSLLTVKRITTAKQAKMSSFEERNQLGIGRGSDLNPGLYDTGLSCWLLW